MSKETHTWTYHLREEEIEKHKKAIKNAMSLLRKTKLKGRSVYTTVGLSIKEYDRLLEDLKALYGQNMYNHSILISDGFDMLIVGG